MDLWPRVHMEGCRSGCRSRFRLQWSCARSAKDTSRQLRRQACTLAAAAVCWSVVQVQAHGTGTYAYCILFSLSLYSVFMHAASAPAGRTGTDRDAVAAYCLNVFCHRLTISSTCVDILGYATAAESLLLSLFAHVRVFALPEQAGRANWPVWRMISAKSAFSHASQRSLFAHPAGDLPLFASPAQAGHPRHEPPGRQEEHHDVGQGVRPEPNAARAVQPRPGHGEHSAHLVSGL